MNIVKITANKNASLIIECDKAEVTLPDGSTEIKEGKFFICRCSQTKNQPYCDGTHRQCNFEE